MSTMIATAAIAGTIAGFIAGAMFASLIIAWIKETGK